MSAKTDSPSLYDGAMAVVANYGPSGIGKTVDQLYSFPNGYFLSPPGALKPAHHVVGYVPDSDGGEAKTIMDATKKVIEIAKGRKYDAVIVDDFSLLAENTVNVLEKKLSGFKLWGAIRDYVLEFRDTARRCGMHVVMTAHESTPRTTNGTFVRGGPRLPGRLPEDLPTACDLVLRAAFDQSRRGWHAHYRCTIDDPNWVTKDRHGVTPDKAPMNTAEILREAGYHIARAPGLEWQENIVSVLADALVETPNEQKALMAEAAAMCADHTDSDLHVRWVMRDALDRSLLKLARKNVLSMFLTDPARTL